MLLSCDGPYDNVLKIKPPMVFGPAEVEALVRCIGGVLAEELTPQAAGHIAQMEKEHWEQVRKREPHLFAHTRMRERPCDCGGRGRYGGSCSCTLRRDQLAPRQLVFLLMPCPCHVLVCRFAPLSMLAMHRMSVNCRPLAWPCLPLPLPPPTTQAIRMRTQLLQPRQPPNCDDGDEPMY